MLHALPRIQLYLAASLSGRCAKAARLPQLSNLPSNLRVVLLLYPVRWAEQLGRSKLLVPRNGGQSKMASARGRAQLSILKRTMASSFGPLVQLAEITVPLLLLLVVNLFFLWTITLGASSRLKWDLMSRTFLHIEAALKLSNRIY